MAGEQQVLEAMQQLTHDAGRVRELQKVEAAGHVACVAAAQARRDLIAQQQQLERDRQALAEQQLQLQRRDAAAAEKEQLLQQKEEALEAEQ
jgi:hypothetical protein